MAADGNAIVEIHPNGSEEALEKADQKDRHSILLWALLVQATDFLIFQIRSILLTVEKGPVSGTVRAIAKQSEPALLGVGVCTALIEAGVRGTDLYRANEQQAPTARLLLGLPLFKLLTLSVFCANDYYEETNISDPAVAKAAGIAFIALLSFEACVSAKMSASLLSTDYMAIAFFVDFFFKAELSAAATLQYFPETAFIGFCLAALGFSAVVSNVITIMRYHYADDANPELTPLQRPDEESGILTSISSINSDNVRSSTSNQTFWEGLSQRAANVLPYFRGDLSTPRPPGG